MNKNSACLLFAVRLVFVASEVNTTYTAGYKFAYYHYYYLTMILCMHFRRLTSELHVCMYVLLNNGYRYIWPLHQVLAISRRFTWRRNSHLTYAR